MVKIRLKRLGARKRPYYRLVVADSRSPRDGRFIEELGTYDPISNPATLRIDAEKVRAWMSRGAQPSDTARSLLEQQGILPRTARAQRPPKADAAAASAPPEPAVAAPSDAEPAVEPADEAPTAAAAPAGDEAEEVTA
ncbi:MAG TPA: 30S ribosomal protein S16 [Candidatus Dormibacteraeota bacterium]